MPFQTDENFLDELDSLEAPASGHRLRVSADMVSLRYRLKQLWKNAGIELLLVLLLFLSLRQVLHTGTGTEEGRQIAAQSLQIARGELDLSKTTDPASLDANERIAWRTSHADSVLLPLALVTLLTGGGEEVLEVIAILLALTSLCAIYATGKELFSPEFGIGAVIIMALLPSFAAHASGLFAITFGYAYTGIALWLLARSRRHDGLPSLILAGSCIALALHAEPLFLYLPVFLVLFWIEAGAGMRQILPVVGGLVAGEVLLMLLSLAITGLPPFAGLAALFTPDKTLDPAGYTGLADLFGQLFTNPQVLPFTLLAVFGIGYTLRASSSSFPWQPMLLLAAAYFTLEFLPKSFSPWTTLPKDGRMLAVLAPPLALVIGALLAGLGNRLVLRWLAIGATALAIPLLFLY